MQIMKYELLNPARLPESMCKDTLGIEVTIPGIVKFNIDPQHGNSTFNVEASTAVEAVCKLFEKGILVWQYLATGDRVLYVNADNTQYPVTKVVTIRPDADAITAMAVIDSGIIPKRKMMKPIIAGDQGQFQNMDRISRLIYYALSKLSFDRCLPLYEKITKIRDWLYFQKFPLEYLVEVMDERRAFTREAEVENHGNFVVVKSENRGAIFYGYEYAPIVIAYNPKFEDYYGNVYKKYTIAVHPTKAKNVKLKALVEMLQEEGWGGSDSIIGSPQGKDSKLTLETVIDTVKSWIETQQI